MFGHVAQQLHRLCFEAWPARVVFWNDGLDLNRHHERRRPNEAYPTYTLAGYSHG